MENICETSSISENLLSSTSLMLLIKPANFCISFGKTLNDYQLSREILRMKMSHRIFKILVKVSDNLQKTCKKFMNFLHVFCKLSDTFTKILKILWDIYCGTFIVKNLLSPKLILGPLANIIFTKTRYTPALIVHACTINAGVYLVLVKIILARGPNISFGDNKFFLTEVSQCQKNTLDSLISSGSVCYVKSGTNKRNPLH